PQRVTDAAQRRSNDWIDPALRLVARCLREIGPERLAAIRRDHRVVWATDPTPVQRPLGAAARAAMRLLADEQKTFGDALRKPGAEPELEDPFPGGADSSPRPSFH